MKTVDWTSMTPLEVWHAVRTAPKVAGPWTQVNVVGIAYRYDTAGRILARGYNEQVKQDIDRQLREAGYLLVDEPVKSKSVMKREAVQSGEEMPTFDKSKEDK